MDFLEFRMYEENILSPLSKKIGLQDIEIGDPKFDAKYMLKGNNERKVKILLSSQHIKDYMLKVDGLTLHIKSASKSLFSGLPENSYQIKYQTTTYFKSTERITHLFTLFSLILNQLYEMKSVKGLIPRD